MFFLNCLKYNVECILKISLLIIYLLDIISMEWKWTRGEAYERTRRMKHQQEIENKEFSKELEKDAYTTSLNHDENTWEIMNKDMYGSGFKVSNKRESLDSKMADRGLTQQIGGNPFLGQNNYIDDVSIRDQFLKPINTTQGQMRANSSANSNANLC